MKIIQVYSNLNVYLILFVTLLVIVLPPSTGAISCSKASSALKKNKSIKYNDLKECLESFPLDAKLATETVDAVLHFLSSYYVFFDRAKENPPSGFTYQRVDLKNELDSLRKKFKSNYSDYDFSTDLRNIIFKLKDGHTSITNLCYQGFSYDQGLSLYSVVTTDKEKKKKQSSLISIIIFGLGIAKGVFEDTVDSSNNNCEVIEIGGKPALQTIKDFANNTIQYSKDLSVRFNMALAPSQQYFLRQFFQQFTLREDLPETSSIKYKLTCPKKGSFTLERKWKITYKDGYDVFSYNCLQQNNETTSSDKITKLTSRDKITKSTLSNKFKTSKSKVSKIAHAKVINEGSLYLLNDKSKSGVVVISGEQSKDEDDLKYSFQELKKNGTKKIILDLSNNPGGEITVALFLTSLLFSSKQPNSFPTDIIINNFTIPKIENFFKTKSTEDDYYNPNVFLSFPFGSHFNSSSDFIGTRKKRTSNLYLNVLTSDEKKLLKNVSFPWTSDDIIIITNGFCASACALISLFLSEIHNVRTIAVGGLLDDQMSFSTYPGGEIASPNEVASSAGDKITDVPGKNALSFTVREAYGFDKNNTVKDVLEYSYKPADCRLYYDEKNAKDPSLLWHEASKILHNEVKC
ncbi:peptidase s41 family protein [Gigaspora margarita]|uniref:Peptidase s41 family protein n=1 Tax=Gigaspora margarita TaxID=4874 RepID=A0A8H3WTX8_GIGMA|nr:peptidase s41 family protein [Gigaspora margarita]